jgi:catechol 2,3-dioxygenase-like lactoylglutathione lyase family enzyme
MNQRIAYVSLLVRDYDEAIAFYTQKLNFELLEDTILNAEKRWVIVAPRGASGCSLLLAKAATAEQVSCIGRQTGGRVFLFLFTDDFWRDYLQMQEREIKFVRPPAEEAYGTVAVFEDLYGNLWDLIQPSEGNRV